MVTLPITLRELILAAAEDVEAGALLRFVADRAESATSGYPPETIISAEKIHYDEEKVGADQIHHQLMFQVPVEMKLPYPRLYVTYQLPKNKDTVAHVAGSIRFDSGNSRVIENGKVVHDPSGLKNIDVDAHGFPIKLSVMLKSHNPLMNAVWKEILYLSESIHASIPLGAWAHFEPLPEKVLNLIGPNRSTYTLLLSPAAFGETFKSCELHLTWPPLPADLLIPREGFPEI